MVIQKMPGLVIAYHGCDTLVAERVIMGEERIKDSVNPYDWLGHGQYFWENSPERAYEWAVSLSKKKSSSVVIPAVVGAIIDLGTCLNLTDVACIRLLKFAYEDMVATYTATLPRNHNIAENDDLLLRNLDCAVIEHLHKFAERFNISFDSVRGVFTEGEPLYPNAGFREKTHIQICVVNPSCIKGYFKPLDWQ